MRRLSLLLAVLFVVPLFGSDSPMEYDDKTVNCGIEGTWRLVEIELNGEVAGTFSYQDVTTFHNGTYTGDTIGGRYRIDPTRSPPHLDWLPSCFAIKDPPTKSMYKIDGDMLITAIMDDHSNNRPQGFKDKGVRVFIRKQVE